MSTLCNTHYGPQSRLELVLLLLMRALVGQVWRALLLSRALLLLLLLQAEHTRGPACGPL
jgi:hypothetical protein